MESDEPAVYCSLDTFPKFNTVEEMLQFDKSMGVATTLPPVVTTVTRTPSWLFRQTFRSVYKELHADHETGAADNK